MTKARVQGWFFYIESEKIKTIQMTLVFPFCFQKVGILTMRKEMFTNKSKNLQLIKIFSAILFFEQSTNLLER